MKASRSKSRANAALAKSAGAIAAGVVVGLLAVAPLPYFIIAPGRAIELRSRVTVDNGSASRARFFLTDVTVARATGFGMLARFLPATEIVDSATVLPPGQSSEAFDRTMIDAMTESQNVAGFVAERAAGYRIADDFIVRVEGFAPTSFARDALEKGDVVLAVAGRAVRSSLDVARAVESVPANAAIPVSFERGNARHTASIRPMLVSGTRRLGVYLSARLPVVDLPVPVRFSIDDVSGASAGLMFALQIYADLRALPVSQAIAGTGTLAPDGSVGPIEGTRQKFEAARRAGATVFFVPSQNAADLAHSEKGTIAVVPVETFSQALAYLKTLR